MFLSRTSALLQLSAVRQTLWLVGLFTLISVVAWGATYFLVQREMLRTVDARLSERMTDAIAILDAGGILPAPEPDQSIAIVITSRRDGFETRDAPGTETEMRYLLRTTEHGRIQIGENTERQEELQDILAGGMQASFLATLLLVCLAGVWMAKRAQARLDTISDGLAQVARGALETRIELSGQDDLTQLANRINETTARLETAMTQMRVQSSNIAHDLRTPLARLRAEIESNFTDAIKSNGVVAPEVLGTTLEQIDRITATFDALLRLARIESGAGREAFRPINLKQLAEEVLDTFGPVVEDAGQSLVLELKKPEEVQGDRDMLVQLVANLIQNAIRYGADAQTVRLVVNGTQLIVSDEGPGIPSEERNTVIQPLYQSETTRQEEGFGLGLSLVRAIAELHDAELTLSDLPEGPGLQVMVSFPKLTKL